MLFGLVDCGREICCRGCSSVDHCYGGVDCSNGWSHVKVIDLPTLGLLSDAEVLTDLKATCVLEIVIAYGNGHEKHFASDRATVIAYENVKA